METINIHRGHYPHPAVFILIWAWLAIAMQLLPPPGLILAGVPLLIAAYTLAAKRLRTIFHRIRWVMVSLLLVYAYATPGEALWGYLAQFSPTYEGMVDGMLQLNRLIFALAGLAILLHLMSQQQLINGLYVLAYPLRLVGLSRARLAVRLALTLHYAESSLQHTAANWRVSIEQMLAQVEIKQKSIELQVIPLAMRDGLLIIMGFALLLLALN